MPMNKFLSILYKLAPIFFQNIAISLFGIKWKKRRFGGIFQEEYYNFKKRESFSFSDWQIYQTSAIRKILDHAAKHVPYYRELFKEYDINISEFTLEKLNKIPFLEKDTLRISGTTKLLSDIREDGGEFYSSSGSTGKPTKILYSKKMQQRYAAAHEARCRNWAGLSIKNPRGMIGGRRVVMEGKSKGPFYRYNIFEKQVYFSAYHINSSNAPNYLKGMLKYKIDYMTGYAMSNYFLARFIEKNNLKAPQLKAVITSSEKLTQEMRDTFKRVYNCKSYDGYSGVEACGMITECEHGKLHISPDVGYIEFIKEDGTYAQPGEVGEMLCTGFLNYDQPLIRYRIGDMARLSKNQVCACGRNMPIIDEIVGRVEDTVIGPDGREMVRFHGIFINLPSVVEGQIIQHTLNQFEVKLVVSQPITELELATIKSRMDSQLGLINLEVNVVPFIERNANGKFKAVISHVKRTS